MSEMSENTFEEFLDIISEDKKSNPKFISFMAALKKEFPNFKSGKIADVNKVSKFLKGQGFKEVAAMNAAIDFEDFMRNESILEQLQFIDEGKFTDFVRGYKDADIQNVIDSLDADKLKSIVSKVSPKSAKRVLSPKEYSYYEKALKRLEEMK